MNQDLDPSPPRANTASSEQAAAFLLSLALGTGADPATALDAHRQRVEALRDPTSDKALEELARQIPVLEALAHRLTAEALREPKVSLKCQLVKAAIDAQQAHARAFTLLRGLALQSKGSAVVTLENRSPTA